MPFGRNPDGKKPLGRKGGGDADAQHARFPQRFDRIDGGGELRKAITQVAEARRACIGQCQPASVAREYRQADMVLEQADLVADRRGRDVQFTRCLGDAHVPGRCLEGPECIERG